MNFDSWLSLSTCKAGGRILKSGYFAGLNIGELLVVLTNYIDIELVEGRWNSLIFGSFDSLIFAYTLSHSHCPFLNWQSANPPFLLRDCCCHDSPHY
jgi:hypothetical protein